MDVSYLFVLMGTGGIFLQARGQLATFQLQSFPESISVFWTYDLEKPPKITKQRLFATYLGPCPEALQFPQLENISLSDKATTIRNLEPSSRYRISLLVTVNGFPENRSEVVETMPGIPGKIELYGINSTSTSISISWELPCLEKNSVISKYVIRYGVDSSFPGGAVTIQAGPELSRATLVELAPSEVYQINIFAVSVGNETGNSSTITAETSAALATATSSSSTTQSRFLAEEGGLSESAIVGMVLGSVVFIAIIASATVCTLVLGKAWLKRYNLQNDKAPVTVPAPREEKLIYNDAYQGLQPMSPPVSESLSPTNLYSTIGDHLYEQIDVRIDNSEYSALERPQHQFHHPS